MRRGQRSAHRWTSIVMTAVVAAILLLAWAVSQPRGQAPAPERLAPPVADAEKTLGARS